MYPVSYIEFCLGLRNKNSWLNLPIAILNWIDFCTRIWKTWDKFLFPLTFVYKNFVLHWTLAWKVDLNTFFTLCWKYCKYQLFSSKKFSVENNYWWWSAIADIAKNDMIYTNVWYKYIQAHTKLEYICITKLESDKNKHARLLYLSIL